ncbi:MAG: histidine kinase, partial [Acaryochloris sp. CRU_2_0]|nr:histidine kinase [Acaryochloris sp. CRU_2_0]
MMSSACTFHLEIQGVQDNCLVKLSWGSGLQLKATLSYPHRLIRLYQDWQRAYLSFYSVAMRGKVEISGTSVLTEVDWRIKLVQAEAALLSEFHQWLRSAELYEIRGAIARAAKQFGPLEGSALGCQWVDVFLNCDPPELDYLPWETWEIGIELGIGSVVRVVRAPANIRHEPMQPRQGRPRILAILGDDTGLDFREELEALEKQLKPLAELVYIGWGITSTTPSELKTQILDALVSEIGLGLCCFFLDTAYEASLTG